MDFAHYAESAVGLVNSDLSTLAAAKAHIDDRAWLVEKLRESDLRPLRRLQADLGAVIDASALGDEMTVVERVNDLLAQHPVRPRISGHDRQSWHLHVNDTDAAVPTILAAEGLFGLALVVTELGADRFGRCAADGCGRAYLDSSANASRRFCSTTCATRTNVAAYRRRKQTVTP